MNNRLAVVKTGEEALSYLNREEPYTDTDRYPEPDVILLDIRMPGINGFDTTEHIRSMDKYKDVPVIILTTSVRADDVNKSFATGADDYIPKPVTIENLLGALSKMGFSLTVFKNGGERA